MRVSAPVYSFVRVCVRACMFMHRSVPGVGGCMSLRAGRGGGGGSLDAADARDATGCMAKMSSAARDVVTSAAREFSLTLLRLLRPGVASAVALALRDSRRDVIRGVTCHGSKIVRQLHAVGVSGQTDLAVRQHDWHRAFTLQSNSNQSNEGGVVLKVQARPD
jgi:hypothetical protein